MRISKVLFILHYPPPIHGAAMMGQYIRESQKINQTFNTRYINLSTSVSIDEIGKGGLKKWGRYFLILYKTFWNGLFWRPDLVYISLSSWGMGLVKDSLIVLLCRLLRLKHVYHFHNKGVKLYAQTALGKRIYPFIFKKAKVILLSPILYQDISAYVPESNVYYCANGIPKVPLKAVSAYPVKSSPIEILFLSNLIESKGVWDVLATCILLKKEKRSFHCTIAGGAGDIKVNEIQQFIKKHHLIDQVSYVGKVLGDQKNAVFESADLFLLPTKEDCFPLVLLEAMQYGLPIISTDEGAISEIVVDGKHGFIVEKHKPNQILEKLRCYFNDNTLLWQHGQAGREKFELMYSNKAFEERLSTILLNII